MLDSRLELDLLQNKAEAEASDHEAVIGELRAQVEALQQLSRRQEEELQIQSTKI